MSKLEKHEIKAVFNQIKKSIEDKNKSIEVSDEEVTKRLIEKYPELSNMFKLEKAYNEAYNKYKQEYDRIEEKYYPKSRFNYDPYYLGYGEKSQLDKEASRVKDEILNERGFIELDEQEIKDKIIVMGASIDLSEIINKLSEELGL
jgi:pyruvate carboxylase